jgi:signal transduction histidine kinase
MTAVINIYNFRYWVELRKELELGYIFRIVFRKKSIDNKRKYGGLGLGLYIVKALVELHKEL